MQHDNTLTHLASIDALHERIAAGTDSDIQDIFLSGKATEANMALVAGLALPHLRALDVSANGLSTAALAPFFAVKRPVLEGVVLSRNQCDDGIISAILAAKYKYLTAVNLSDNHIGNASMAALAAVDFAGLTIWVAENNAISVIPECDLSRLEYIDVRGNPIDEATMRRLVYWAISRNTVLKMDGHILDYDYLRECINTHQESLKYVNIAGQDVDREALDAMKTDFSHIPILSKEKNGILQ